MCIIDNHSKRLSREDRLEPPGHAGEFLDAAANRIRRHTQPYRYTDGGRNVVHVGPANQLRMHLECSDRRSKDGVRIGIHVRCSSHSKRDDMRRSDRAQFVETRIIHIQDEHARNRAVQTGEEPLFGLEVRTHTGMEVEVVAAQVCKHGHVEVQTLHTFEGDRVRRHFHHRILPTGVRNAREQQLQIRRFRRGPLGRIPEIRAAILDRPENRRWKPRRFQDRFNQVGCGRLAISAGHPNCMEFFRRTLVEVRGDDRERGAVVGRLNPWRANALRRRGCGNDGCRSIQDGLLHKPVSIRAQSLYRNKQRTSRDLP